MKRSWLAATPLIVALLVSACNGSEDASDSTISTVVTTTASPSTTVAATDAPATAAPTPAPTPAPTAAPTPAPTAAPTAAPTDAPADTTAPPSDLPTEICLTRMQEAVESGADYVEAYYPPLAECTGLDDWLAAAEETGFDPGEDLVEWAAETCALDGPIVAVTCQEAIEAARA